MLRLLCKTIIMHPYSMSRTDNKPFQHFSFRYRLTYRPIDRNVITSGCVVRTGYFLSQPITTLENISYISLAQPELKKLRIISQTNYLTVTYLLVNNVSRGECSKMPRVSKMPIPLK